MKGTCRKGQLHGKNIVTIIMRPNGQMYRRNHYKANKKVGPELTKVYTSFNLEAEWYKYEDYHYYES